MKKVRAVRSASETQLRTKATSYVSSKNRKGRVLRAVTAARLAGAIDKASRPKKEGSKKDPTIIDAEVVSRTDSQGPQFTPSTRVVRQVTGGKKAPAALPAPAPAPKAGPKKSRGPKKEKTPGMQTVFKATPAVDLREGDNFGKITHTIEKTFQPKTPRKKKDA